MLCTHWLTSRAVDEACLVWRRAERWNLIAGAPLGSDYLAFAVQLLRQPVDASTCRLRLCCWDATGLQACVMCCSFNFRCLFQCAACFSASGNICFWPNRHDEQEIKCKPFIFDCGEVHKQSAPDVREPYSYCTKHTCMGCDVMSLSFLCKTTSTDISEAVEEPQRDARFPPVSLSIYGSCCIAFFWCLVFNSKSSLLFFSPLFHFLSLIEVF